MGQVRGGGGRWAGVRVGVAALLLLAFAGTARAQFPSEVHEGANKSLDAYTEALTWLPTLLTVVVVVGSLVLVLSVTARFYVRWSATTDPEKLALSDPWVRAHLDRLKTGAADDAPAQAGPEESAEGPPAIPRPE